MQTRKDKLEQSRDLLVEMRPEFATALNNSLNFSSKVLLFLVIIAERGRAANLLKGSSKRKRGRAELEEVKEEEKAFKGDRQGFLQEFKRLRQEEPQLQQQVA